MSGLEIPEEGAGVVGGVEEGGGEIYVAAEGFYAGCRFAEVCLSEVLVDGGGLEDGGEEPLCRRVRRRVLVLRRGFGDRWAWEGIVRVWREGERWVGK